MKVLILSIITIFLYFYFVPPISQNQHYHDFADKRVIIGLNNFSDVVSNLCFLIVGIYGFFRKETRKSIMTKVYFVTMILIAFGSSYYHYNPDNKTLFWDRLPMAVGFMILLAVILEHRVNRLLGRLARLPLILFGIASVIWWSMFDDLKPYLLIQFGSLIYIVYLLYLQYKKRGYVGTKLLYLAIGLYIIAKILELGDKLIFYFTLNIISGHTLKHIVAAVASFYSGQYILKQKREKPIELIV